MKGGEECARRKRRESIESVCAAMAIGAYVASQQPCRVAVVEAETEPLSIVLLHHLHAARPSKAESARCARGTTGTRARAPKAASHLPCTRKLHMCARSALGHVAQSHGQSHTGRVAELHTDACSHFGNGACTSSCVPSVHTEQYGET
eukprot:6214053-Pleurochrysis_carterae.AAC.11